VFKLRAWALSSVWIIGESVEPYLMSISVTSTRKQWVLEILSWSTYKIVRKEVYNTIWKSKVSKNQIKHTVVQREKELYNIKYYYTSFESLGLASLN